MLRLRTHARPWVPLTSTQPISGRSRPLVKSRAQRRQVELDAAHRVDDVLEADEVDLDVVVDGDAERLLDGLDQALGARRGRRRR